MDTLNKESTSGSRRTPTPGPPCPQYFFKIRQFSVNCRGNPPILSNFGLRARLGLKLCWAPSDQNPGYTPRKVICDVRPSKTLITPLVFSKCYITNPQLLSLSKSSHWRGLTGLRSIFNSLGRITQAVEQKKAQVFPWMADTWNWGKALHFPSI